MSRLSLTILLATILTLAASGCVSAAGSQMPVQTNPGPTDPSISAADYDSQTIVVRRITAENVMSLPGPARREAIRNMPLLERPNRPGHFYGNTVRRLNALRNGGY